MLERKIGEKKSKIASSLAPACFYSNTSALDVYDMKLLIAICISNVTAEYKYNSSYYKTLMCIKFSDHKASL